MLRQIIFKDFYRNREMHVRKKRQKTVSREKGCGSGSTNFLVVYRRTCIWKPRDAKIIKGWKRALYDLPAQVGRSLSPGEGLLPPLPGRLQERKA